MTGLAGIENVPVTVGRHRGGRLTQLGDVFATPTLQELSADEMTLTCASLLSLDGVRFVSDHADER